MQSKSTAALRVTRTKADTRQHICAPTHSSWRLSLRQGGAQESPVDSKASNGLAASRISRRNILGRLVENLDDRGTMIALRTMRRKSIMEFVTSTAGMRKSGVRSFCERKCLGTLLKTTPSSFCHTLREGEQEKYRAVPNPADRYRRFGSASPRSSARRPPGSPPGLRFPGRRSVRRMRDAREARRRIDWCSGSRRRR